MPVFPDQYPLQLPAQAETALHGWYTKELKKDKKPAKEELAEKIAEKVRRVMRVQFPAEGDRIAALPRAEGVLLESAPESEERAKLWTSY